MSKGKSRKRDQQSGIGFKKIAASGHSSGIFGPTRQFCSRIADFKIAAGGHSCGTLNLVSLPGLTFTCNFVDFQYF